MNQRHQEQRERDQRTVEGGSKLCQWYFYSEGDVLPQNEHHHALQDVTWTRQKGICWLKIQSAQEGSRVEPVLPAVLY